MEIANLRVVVDNTQKDFKFGKEIEYIEDNLKDFIR